MTTRQDFEATALTLRSITNNEEREKSVAAWVNHFKKQNKRFNEAKFRAACEPATKGKPAKKIKFAVLPTFVQRRNRYQVCFDSLANWKDLGKDIESVTVNGKTFLFEDLVCQQRYSANHQWAGQVQGSWVNTRDIYKAAVGKDHWLGEHRNWDGMVCAGRQSMDLCDFISDFLFQVKSDDTDACTNLMGPWIAYEVEPENVVKFEQDLAAHLEAFKGFQFTFKA